MREFLTVLRRFKDFSGRSRRREYWIFFLITSITSLVLRVLDSVLGLDFGDGNIEYGVLGTIYLVIIFIPSLALSVRRLHDTGRSGWYWLIGFIPLVGGLWILARNVSDSEPGTNNWGPNPKETAPMQGGAWS
ncbi:DUF805 domain-containing protein [Deinococcus sp. Arct2-2]|uniref:DUF805 domain-containing protein n=1 Tax=Deinococcus sp. Arct2-2 TaxID=2568653 RepID=UPI0010A54DAB|nr:DUF805 domain-containing protein [Deinococcus sp. Arct2-2]THF67817.1 DUF805 domain-containing protein [Deinococcus sp. Arct2-2]